MKILIESLLVILFMNTFLNAIGEFIYNSKNSKNTHFIIWLFPSVILGIIYYIHFY